MQEQNENEITLKELIQKVRGFFYYLRTKWIIIVFAGLVGGIIGFGYAYFSKPVYTATLSFALEEDKGSGISGAMGLASQLGLDLGGNAGGAFSAANLLELMKSRMLVEKALLNPVSIDGKMISLAELYIRFNKWRESWKDNPEIASITFLPNADRSKFTLQQDSILGIIYANLISANLNVGQKDKKTSINIIEVRSNNEMFSKLFTETLAAEVSGFYVETKTKKSMQNVEILQKQVDSVRRELNAALTGAAVLTDNIYNLNPAMNAKRVSPAKKQIDVQANTAILTQLVQNLELSKMALMRETPLIQVIDRPVLPLKKEKQSKRNGLMYGGFLAGFLAVFSLLLKRFWEKIF